MPSKPVKFKKRPARKKKEWSVYIVRCADSTLYTGIAKDVNHRIGMHNSGKGAKYIVEERRPVELLFVEEGYTNGDALKRERNIKKLPKKQKERLVNGGK
jgi:putative endonuclease